MLRDYYDIIEKLGPPLWWDDQGVPRYCEFDPDALGVYDHVAVLLNIACQDCAEPFTVAMSLDGMQLHNNDLFDSNGEIKVDAIRELLHYGDPPPHDCVGDTMNCEDIEVLQFWVKPRLQDWVRVPKMEGTL